MNDRDQEIYNQLLTYKVFTEKEYQDLCNKYGKERIFEFVNYFVSKANQILDSQEIDNFLKNYSILFEDETELSDYEQNNSSFKLSETISQYLKSISETKLLTVEEEKEIFTDFNNLYQELSIINILDTAAIEIDYASLFMSIKDERQIKSLIKLYNASYAPKGTTYYEKILNSKNDRETIEKYLKLYNKENCVLSPRELTTNFKEIDFNKYKLLDKNDYDKQIEYLISFLTIFKKIQYANLKLVFSIAKRYTKKRGDILDFIQEGNINGLTKAILRFDIRKGYKFSTYASWWIMQAVTRYSKNYGSLIRKPVHMTEKIQKYKQVYARLLIEKGREPTKEELCEGTGFTIAECLDIEKISMEPTSLDVTIGEDDSSTLLDFVPSEDATNEDSVEEQYEKKALREAIEKVLVNLTPREETVIRLRFGLNPEQKVMTLGDIGDMYGITRERIRQIEIKALSKLKKPKNAKIIKDFL